MGVSSTVERGYIAIQEDFDRSRSGGWADFFWIKEILPKNGKILDLGCGNGRLFASLTEYQDISYTGIDANTFFVQRARERFEADVRHPRFIPGDMRAAADLLGDEGASFDVVCFGASFHHLMSAGERLAVLKSAYELLKPGGRIVLLNWNLWRWSLSAKSVWRYTGKFLFDPGYRRQLRIELGSTRWRPNEVMTEWSRGGAKTLLYYHAFSCFELNRLLSVAGFTEINSFYSLRGVRASVRNAENIVSFARKPLK